MEMKPYLLAAGTLLAGVACAQLTLERATFAPLLRSAGSGAAPGIFIAGVQLTGDKIGSTNNGYALSTNGGLVSLTVGGLFDDVETSSTYSLCFSVVPTNGATIGDLTEDNICLVGAGAVQLGLTVYDEACGMGDILGSSSVGFVLEECAPGDLVSIGVTSPVWVTVEFLIIGSPWVGCSNIVFSVPQP
jgi:hypothetical protein